MKTIQVPLTKGFIALVDEEDYKLISSWKWMVRLTVDGKPYAMRRLRRVRNESGAVIMRGNVMMHRQIMGFPAGKCVDHANGNTLDNRRENLRICTKRQNCANRINHSTGKSGFKGVTWVPKLGKWIVRVGGRDQRRVIGYFEDVTEGAKAYNKAALEMYGEFASLNKVS